ncbi:ABC transporter substrate-binding protein [Candidatus Microgenomates bacterium]|nr:MAG: ABC transporter substrate-binding protein [Candidatus Microgenomates bacterium]
MIVLRKRLIFWLFKAYLKKLRKQIFFFFLIGLVFFFIFRLSFDFLASKIIIEKKESIGIVGAYTLDNLPQTILTDLSSGLTSISSDGTPVPNIAESWKIKDNGKTYLFNLKKNVYFSDGKNLTSDDLNYKFVDAQIKKPEKYTVEFKLKDVYAPFLVTVSKPIFRNNLVGVGNYKIKEIKLNGNFIQLMSLTSIKDHKTKIYQFYPTQISLKTAFALGEVSKISGLSDVDFENISFYKYPNLDIQKKENLKILTTLFFNTQDPVISDKKLRNALAYALPDEFENGKKSYSLFSPNSWAYSLDYIRLQDIAHAENLISQSSVASKSASLKIEIKTLSKYKKTAQEISKAWEKVGVKAKIDIVDSIPSSFQTFLGDFYLPNDPDQYTLWHSNQDNNITNYKSLRIDKLLEDGRKTIDLNTRKKIYLDFQKYLLDDTPASFLYFPYEYEVARK